MAVSQFSALFLVLLIVWFGFRRTGYTVLDDLKVHMQTRVVGNSSVIFFLDLMELMTY